MRYFIPLFSLRAQNVPCKLSSYFKRNINFEYVINSNLQKNEYLLFYLFREHNVFSFTKSLFILIMFKSIL